MFFLTIKRVSCFIVFTGTLVALESSYKKADHANDNFEGTGRWTGTLSLDETVIHSNGAVNGQTETHVHVVFTDALPTLNREEDSSNLQFGDDKGTGTYRIQGEATMVGGQKCSFDCQGGGVAVLNAVNINEEANTYDIDVLGPKCTGTKTCSGEETKPYSGDDNEIIVSEHKLLDKDVLSGSETKSSELPGELGTITRTIKWHLIRSATTDVELIVTPEAPNGYDNWLPKPGVNEMMKGSMMTISLKLQGKNGNPLRAKADSFVLTLSNTSREPGITINYPLIPDTKQLPDLRFLLDPRIESVDEDQTISVGSTDGITGKAFIGSYDGGGWATLTVEAFLNDKRHIKGHLLVSGGDVDILIPKRTPGNKIALAWANDHGDPQDMDDNEKSSGNKNNGDGLTAYEEYRGVISEGKFKRLDPEKKELGVMVQRSQLPMLSEGLKWFKNATDVETIPFWVQEIAVDRRLNRNVASAHIYDQCAVYLYEAQLSGSYGHAYMNDVHPDIPKNAKMVIVCKQNHTGDYQIMLSASNNSLPFSESDFFASTIAHELGHAVNVNHHGDKNSMPSPDTVTDLVSYHIFDKNGVPILQRPYIIEGDIGVIHSSESGDLNCVMAYHPYYDWAYHLGSNGAHFFYEVPITAIGKQMCTSDIGTGLNAASQMGNTRYFGNADSSRGNCLSQIKLKD
jgi:hypothetical protein